jgi:hypothetical protein
MWYVANQTFLPSGVCCAESCWPPFFIGRTTFVKVQTLNKPPLKHVAFTREFAVLRYTIMVENYTEQFFALGKRKSWMGANRSISILLDYWSIQMAPPNRENRFVLQHASVRSRRTSLPPNHFTVADLNLIELMIREKDIP